MSRSDGTRSSRPAWLGPVVDARKFDHVRIHLQLLDDRRLGTQLVGTKRPFTLSKSVVLAVYMGLVRHAELGTGYSWPSAALLGMYAGCDERTVRFAIWVLERLGYVGVDRQPGKASTYRVLAPPALDDADDLAFPERVSHPRSSSSAAGVASVPSGCDIPTGPGVTPDEQEPENENQRTSRSSSSRARHDCGSQADDDEDPRISEAIRRVAKRALEEVTIDRGPRERPAAWLAAVIDDYRGRGFAEAMADHLDDDPDADVNELVVHIDSLREMGELAEVEEA